MNKYTKWQFIILPTLCITLMACAPPKCEEKEPDYKFERGELAKFKLTGEDVRVLRQWKSFGGRCAWRRKGKGYYDVSFPDRSEVYLKWNKLEKKSNAHGETK